MPYDSKSGSNLESKPQAAADYAKGCRKGGEHMISKAPGPKPVTKYTNQGKMDAPKTTGLKSK